jgi:hypothetical protein
MEKINKGGITFIEGIRRKESDSEMGHNYFILTEPY